MLVLEYKNFTLDLKISCKGHSEQYLSKQLGTEKRISCVTRGILKTKNKQRAIVSQR